MTDRKGDVLLVDDDPAVRLTLSAVLDEHFRVMEAANVREAKEHLAAKTFDVIVSDHHMPDGLGIELLKTVEQTAKHTVGILITGSSGDADVKRLVETTLTSGRTLVLYKPVRPEDLLLWVKNGVALAALSRAKQAGAARRP